MDWGNPNGPPFGSSYMAYQQYPPEQPLTYQPRPLDGEVEDDDNFYGYGGEGEGNNMTCDGMPVQPTGSSAIGPQPAATYLPAQPLATPAKQSEEQQQKKMIDSNAKAAELRAKLLARRQNTPAKTASEAAASRPETPSKQNTETMPKPATAITTTGEDQYPFSDAFGLESLIAEGKAAAEAAKVKQEIAEQEKLQSEEQANQQKQPPSVEPVKHPDASKKPNSTSKKQQVPIASSSSANLASSARPIADRTLSNSNDDSKRSMVQQRAQSGHPGPERPIQLRRQSSTKQLPTPKPTQAFTGAGLQMPAAVPNPVTDVSLQVANATVTAPNHPVSTQDAYYADLPGWLEITGYHDVAYRESKLKGYKKLKAIENRRRALDEEYAKVQEENDADMQALRSSTVRPSVAVMLPPPVPATLLTGFESTMPAAPKSITSISQTPATTPVATNGLKRAHSPEPVPASANKDMRTDAGDRRRHDEPGFRIRGAEHDSPDHRPVSRRLTPSPKALDRRISYPERRASPETGHSYRSRDPSLERRQAYYQRRDRSPPRFEEGYGSYSPRAAGPFNHGHGGGRGRPPFEGKFNTPRTGPRGGYRNEGRLKLEYGPGSASLELRKGGVRYFMIKSWNHDNVMNAQRDGLWATQVKNELLFTEAFNTSRHVMLLFSVNKSMGFQGYALMTSPPTSSLPKPPFCAKLNWPTSPAFRIQWFATTPVHFRLIGHLKNNLNVDESGESRAVLVGKDGQEISEHAGAGVCEVLDEIEAVERDRRAQDPVW